MREFQIITDTNSDLPKKYVMEKKILQIPQYTLLEGITYEGAEGIDPVYFYEKMAKGVEPQSQAINPMVAEETFRKVLDLGKDILYISFASTLSGSYNTAMMVANNLSEEYTQATIKVVDSMSASLSEGLLVMKAIEMQEANRTLLEIEEWLEKYKFNVVTMFTVDDLHHLQRGGRISKTTAVVGSVINIKPILNLTKEGLIKPAGSVRGRKKSIHTLIDTMEEKMTEEWVKYNSTVVIMHGNCIEDANKVAKMVKEKFNIKNIVINDINPSIGVHSGPGALVLSFFGTER